MNDDDKRNVLDAISAAREETQYEVNADTGGFFNATAAINLFDEKLKSRINSLFEDVGFHQGGEMRALEEMRKSR